MNDAANMPVLACGGKTSPHTCARHPAGPALGEECPRLVQCLQALHPFAPCALIRFELRADGSSSLPFASENFIEIQHVSPGLLRHDTMPVFNLLHPQDFDRVFISMTQSARSITPWHQEYRILPPGGGLRWLRSCLLPHRAGEGLLTGYGVMVDITTEKKCRDELQALCGQGGVGVYRAAEDGRLLAVNERFARICGYDSPDELLRAQPTTLDMYLIHPEERSVMMRLVKAHGSVQRYALEARTRDGGSVWLSMNLRLVPQAPGEPMLYDAFCADITGQMARDLTRGHAREFDRTRFGPGPSPDTSPDTSPGPAPGPAETEKPAGVSTGGLCPVLAHARDAILWRVRLPGLA